MKIRGIDFDNHTILGDLKLDFTNPENGKAYDTILLIGENGVGKTSIMQEITTFLMGGTIMGFAKKFSYELGSHSYDMTKTDSVYNWYFKRSKDGQPATILEYSGSTNREKMKADAEDPRNSGVVFSKARADFKTANITTISSTDIDSAEQDDDSKNEYSHLKQLIIDIDSIDSEEFKRRHASGDPIEYTDFQKNSRIARFSNAFNAFFENIRYKGIETANGIKEIYFEKFGKPISVDSLSTGEKQIVFRGISILRNLKKIQGGVVLIDEPELSMHPRWQQKILKYYQNLFTNPASGQQTVQLIIATHSERILTSAFEEKKYHGRDNGVIVISNENGTVTAETVTTPGLLLTITAAETNYIAYKVPTVDYHIQLFAALQHKYGDINLADTDTQIMSEPVYDSTRHEKKWRFLRADGTLIREYQTLPVYVRNAIDHPDPTGLQVYTPQELRLSIELMRQLI